ncbi:DedA family protein [Enteractinococcus helveticum]|uniref:DedA family protein n=1 Tax=Enteractinococcus helveticum TaxID=1837282 RepID=UPI000B27F6CB|nr:DedA family protein [Enteractinococcus helveticum]
MMITPIVLSRTGIATPPEDVSYGWLGDIVVAVMEALGPIGLSLAVFIENVFPPIPSELFLALAGFTAASGTFTPAAGILWATIGSVTGAWVLYGLGAWFGRYRLYKAAYMMPLVDIDDVERTERWFLKYGYWTVFFGRMIPIFRSLISIPAGLERMNFWLFTLFTAIGSLIWNTIFLMGGYLLGSNFHLISDYADVFSNVVLSAVVVVLAIWVTVRIVRNRRRANDPNYQPESPEEAAARIDRLVAQKPYGSSRSSER